MSQFIFKMPDLGEGTVDAEIVAWHTKPGDAVQEDQLIGALSVIDSGSCNWIPHISDRVESDGFDAAAGLEQEAGNQTSLEHPESKSSSSRNSSATPDRLLDSSQDEIARQRHCPVE